jgi:hypothetical protein
MFLYKSANMFHGQRYLRKEQSMRENNGRAFADPEHSIHAIHARILRLLNETRDAVRQDFIPTGIDEEWG